MTIIKNSLFAALVLLISNSALAYSPEMEKEACKKPKFTDFSLPEYHAKTPNEVAPETEFFFKVSVWADPESIKVTAKGKAFPARIESTSTFHKINMKLPPEMTGQFVRLNVTATAVLGCDHQHGWLIKVADK